MCFLHGPVVWWLVKNGLVRSLICWKLHIYTKFCNVSILFLTNATSYLRFRESSWNNSLKIIFNIENEIVVLNKNKCEKKWGKVGIRNVIQFIMMESWWNDVMEFIMVEWCKSHTVDINWRRVPSMFEVSC